MSAADPIVTLIFVDARHRGQLQWVGDAAHNGRLDPDVMGALPGST
jgi:hypothetical protein